jgi:hypothetical protein
LLHNNKTHIQQHVATLFGRIVRSTLNLLLLVIHKLSYTINYHIINWPASFDIESHDKNENISTKIFLRINDYNTSILRSAGSPKNVLPIAKKMSVNEMGNFMNSAKRHVSPCAISASQNSWITLYGRRGLIVPGKWFPRTWMPFRQRRIIFYFFAANAKCFVKTFWYFLHHSRHASKRYYDVFVNNNKSVTNPWNTLILSSWI